MATAYGNGTGPAPTTSPTPEPTAGPVLATATAGRGRHAVPPEGTDRTDGGAAGYAAGRTFRLRTEFRRQFRRRRTLWTYALLVALPIVVMLAFVFGSDGTDRSTGFLGLATAGAANFAVFVLLVSASFLLVIVIALFCGDTVASDASNGSLRYLLALPVPRSRLLWIKLAVGLLSSLAAVVLLTVVSLVVGAIVFGWHPLQTVAGDDVPAVAALLRIAGLIGYVSVWLLAIAAFAFLLSVSTDAALGAVGGAVLVFILAGILDQIDALGDLRALLPTHYQTAFLGLLTTPVQTDEMVRGAIASLVYAALCLVLAWYRFLRKDVTS